MNLKKLVDIYGAEAIVDGYDPRYPYLRALYVEYSGPSPPIAIMEDAFIYLGTLFFAPAPNNAIQKK